MQKKIVVIVIIILIVLFPFSVYNNYRFMHFGEAVHKLSIAYQERWSIVTFVLLSGLYVIVTYIRDIRERKETYNH